MSCILAYRLLPQLARSRLFLLFPAFLRLRLLFVAVILVLLSVVVLLLIVMAGVEVFMVFGLALGLVGFLLRI